MTLDILIPTLPNRYGMLKRLQNILVPQVNRHADRVSIHYNDAGRSIPTGQKRNMLIDSSVSDYFVFVDDDDLIPVYYIDEMLKAIDKNPDVVTFIGYMTTDGERRKDFTIKLNERYEERNGHYYRYPNHLCAFKRSLVKGIRFPHVHIQEDFQWAKKVHDSRVLKTEVHINKEMYIYDYRSKK